MKIDKKFISYGGQTIVAIDFVKYFIKNHNEIKFHFVDGGVINWTFSNDSETNYVYDYLFQKFVSKIDTLHQYKATKAKKEMDKIQ